jgi:hypothetical protein
MSNTDPTKELVMEPGGMHIIQFVSGTSMKNTLWYILNDNIEVSLYVDDFLICYLEEILKNV